ALAQSQRELGQFFPELILICQRCVAEHVPQGDVVDDGLSAHQVAAQARQPVVGIDLTEALLEEHAAAVLDRFGAEDPGRGQDKAQASLEIEVVLRGELLVLPLGAPPPEERRQLTLGPRRFAGTHGISQGNAARTDLDGRTKTWPVFGLVLRAYSTTCG